MIGWYWFYDFELNKDGYETYKTRERFRARWWQVFPIDFVAEVIPLPFLDEREVFYTLTPRPLEKEPGMIPGPETD